MKRRRRWLVLCSTAALVGMSIPAAYWALIWTESRRPAEYYLIHEGMTREEVIAALGRGPNLPTVPQVWWFEVGDGRIGVRFDHMDQVYDWDWYPPPPLLQWVRMRLGL